MKTPLELADEVCGRGRGPKFLKLWDRVRLALIERDAEWEAKLAAARAEGVEAMRAAVINRVMLRSDMWLRADRLDKSSAADAIQDDVAALTLATPETP